MIFQNPGILALRNFSATETPKSVLSAAGAASVVSAELYEGRRGFVSLHFNSETSLLSVTRLKYSLI
jgi:hypothetical protein